MKELEEVIRRAENGDRESMRALIGYYSQQNDFENLEKWADNAAEAGDVYGHLVSIRCHEFDATVWQQMGRMDAVEREWQTVLNRCDVLMKAHRSGNICLQQKDLGIVTDTLKKAKYGISQAKYFQDEQCATDLIPLLRDVDSPESYALYGICCIAAKDVKSAYEAFRHVAQDQKYAAKEKSVAEEGTYANALFDLAIIYRTGIPGLVGQDLNAAVDTLTFACQVVRDADFRRRLQTELGRYRKKMLGGYKYVE